MQEHSLQTIVKNIVMDALFAPTGDNCQCWKFSWNGKHLSIIHNMDRARHYFDFNHFASYISLGTVIESIAISAAQFNFSIDVEFYLPIENSNQTVAGILLVPTNGLDSKLTLFLKKRVTDRRLYKPLPLANFTKEQINQLSDEEVAITILENPDPQLCKTLSCFDDVLFRNQQAHNDFYRWLHKGTEPMRRDGLPLSTLGATPLELTFMSMGRSFTVQKILNFMGSNIIAKMRAAHLIKKSSALVCFSAQTTNPAHTSLVSVGRRAMRAWLLLNSSGYGVQPLTLATLPLYAMQQNHLPEDFDKAQAQKISSIKKTLDARFNISPKFSPVWLLRTGSIAHLPAAPRAPRLNLEEVYSVELK